MPALASIADVRDVVIIVYGIIGVIFFLVAVIVLAIVGFGVRGLIRAVKDMLDDSVKPTLESVKGAAETVRGTTEFVSKTAVSPIVRTYGAFAGARKGLSVLAGLAGRKEK